MHSRTRMIHVVSHNVIISLHHVNNDLYIKYVYRIYLYITYNIIYTLYSRDSRREDNGTE